MMPHQLQSLFVRILIHCQPHHPELLWNLFKDALSENFLRLFDTEIAYKKAYAAISKLLQQEGYNLSDFPSMDQTQYDELIESENIDNSLDLAEILYSKANEDQKYITDTVLAAVKNECQNKCVYIDGPGGSGKTFIYKILYHKLKSENFNVLTTSFTGIAATLWPEGKTLHKIFGLPVPLFSDSTSNIMARSKEGQNLKNADINIWDEAPMAPRYALEVIDITLKDIKQNNKPFGGS